MHTRTTRTAAVAAALALTMTVGGCSLLRGGEDALPAPSRSTSATPTPTPTPSATAGTDAAGQTEADLLRESASPRPPTAAPTEAPRPAPTMSSIPPGTVVSEGDVASPKGSVHFHFRVVADQDDRFAVQYSGFTSTLPVPVSASFLRVTPAVGDGMSHTGDGDHQLGGATATPGPTVSVPMAQAGHDPSFLGALVTYSSATPDAAVPVEIGPSKVLAVTPLSWSVPARTTNVHPTDGGAAANATGTVPSTTDSGAPASYVVAPDDLIGDVAARFGLSVEDLVWLNPSLTVFGDQQYLYEGTTMNLDPLRR